MSTADAGAGSLLGVAEVRELVTLGTGGSSLSTSEPCWDCVCLFCCLFAPSCHSLSLLPPVSEGFVPILTWELHMVPPVPTVDGFREPVGIA